MLQNEEAQALSGSILERKDRWSLPLYDKIYQVLLLDEAGRSRLSQDRGEMPMSTQALCQQSERSSIGDLKKAGGGGIFSEI